ncbi:unnamed protein product [Effrenium voratum]|nr:unnamed protein product [Effrenium voratum]
MLTQCCGGGADLGQEVIAQTRGCFNVDSPEFCDGKSAGDMGRKEHEVRQAHTYSNGSTYTGEWQGLVRHGFGIQVWPDGASYQGQWCHDMANGLGVFRHSDGDVYEGQWKNDKADGFGLYTTDRKASQPKDGDVRHANGSSYVGEWKEDLQHGHGIETWADGARYMGLYDRGVKDGKGCFTWTDSSTYCGDFRNNEICGHGQYNWGDGREYFGRWSASSMQGAGRFTWPDGKVYEGGYVNDLKECRKRAESSMGRRHLQTGSLWTRATVLRLHGKRNELCLIGVFQDVFHVSGFQCSRRAAVATPGRMAESSWASGELESSTAGACSPHPRGNKRFPTGTLGGNSPTSTLKRARSHPAEVDCARQRAHPAEARSLDPESRTNRRQLVLQVGL